MKDSLRHYKSIDLARLMCACLVVFIHMGLDGSVAFIPCFTRQAVPFFFLVSGFFFTKNAEKANDFKRFAVSYIKPVLLVYLCWVLFWLPYYARETLINYSDRSAYYSVAVLLRRIFLAGIAPYWYLLVLTEGSAILSVLLNKKAYKTGWFLAIVGLILMIIYELHFKSGFGALVYKLFYLVFSWSCNVIMSGFPLLFLGSFIARHETTISSRVQWPLILIYIAVVVFSFVIYSKFESLFGIPVGIIEAVLLFLICLIPSRLEEVIPIRLCRSFRNVSSVIFLTHTAFLTVLGEVFNIWGTAARFTIAFIGAIILTCLIKAINWKPLNKLFMIR